MGISIRSHLYSNAVIAAKFCTWHDSCAVVACAKICCDLMASNRVIAKRNFHRIWIAGKKPLLKRAPVHDTVSSNFGFILHCQDSKLALVWCFWIFLKPNVYEIWQVFGILFNTDLLPVPYPCDCKSWQIVLVGCYQQRIGPIIPKSVLANQTRGSISKPCSGSVAMENMFA